MLKVGAVIIAIIVVVLLFARWFSPSAREMLDWQLDDLAETESRRLSSESGHPVCVTVSLDLIEKRDDPQHPLLDLALQVERVKAVRELPIVLNARTDVYLLEIGSPEKRYEEALRRLAAFRDAGADCVFVPGVRDPATIARLVKDLQCPVNILGGPGIPSVPELQKLGVARVSLGSGPMRATLGLLRRLAEELKNAGTYAMLEGAIPYAELNRMMK